jgi:type IV pilus assembly protein PilW
MTLIEALVSMVLSSLIILTISMLMSFELHTASHFIQRMQLQRELASAIQLMQNDLRRAGANRAGDGSIALRQMKQLIAVTQAPTRIGYAYRVAKSGASQYRQVVYQLVHQSGHALLQLCETYTAQPLTLTEAGRSSLGSPCFSMFDSQQIQVASFQVIYRSLGSAVSQSGWVSVHLAIFWVHDPTIRASMHFSVMQRNWSYTEGKEPD